MYASGFHTQIFASKNLSLITTKDAVTGLHPCPPKVGRGSSCVKLTPSLDPDHSAIAIRLIPPPVPGSRMTQLSCGLISLNIFFSPPPSRVMDHNGDAMARTQTLHRKVVQRRTLVARNRAKL